MYYSAIGLLAALILIIENWDILNKDWITQDRPAWKIYRRFLFVVLVYYVTDILWGILESNKLSTGLFIDTTVYFIAMAVGIACWADYTVAYLEEKNSFGRFLVYACRFITVVIAIASIINIFVPILFTVNRDCIYKALPFRYVGLICQILMLLIISVYALYSMIHTDRATVNRTRYRILASFGIAMAVSLFLQLWFPLLPLYAIGYMLGTCALHSFVASDEREDYKREIEESKKVNELKDTITSLLDNMTGMTFSKDAKTGIYLACNQAFAEFAHKKKPDEVVGLTDRQIFDPDTAAHIIGSDKLALKLSKPYIFYEDSFDAADNQRQLQTTKLKYKDASGRLCILGMCQDVTDMVRVQHEQAMTQEAYESAVSSGLMYTQIAHTLARDYLEMYYVNTDTEEYIEYRNGLEGKNLSEVRRGWHFFSDCRTELAESVYEDDRESFMEAIKRKTLMKALSRKDTFSMTYRQADADGPVYVNMKISRMEDEHYIIIVFTDVNAEVRETMTKNRALSEALASAEQARKENTKLLSGMSHKLRTPLNAIISLDALAMKNENLDDNTRDYLEKIKDSSGQLLSILNDMLSSGNAGIGSGSDEVSKDEISLENISEDDRKNNKAAMRVLVVDDDPIEVEYSVMMLNEAGIYAEACTSGQEALRRLELQHAKQHPYNLLLLDWNMPGMNGRETAAEVMKLYSGETTVVALTAYNWEDIEKEAHSVNVEDYLQKPLFSLDVSNKLEDIALRNHMNVFKVKNQAKLVGRRILLAEDVQSNADILMEIFEIENINVDHADNGKEAVELFDKSTEGIYAAILMDIRMPVMDGLDAAKAIRSMDRKDAKRIPIIVLTGNTFDEDIQLSIQAGMNAYLTKPVETDQLLRVLGELIYEAEH